MSESTNTICKIQCELCGGIDIKKNDEGLFQCQSCGCKYTLNQAKTLLSTSHNTDTPTYSIEGGVLKKYTGNDEIINIPEGVIAIGEDAFYGNLAAKEIIIPKTVKEIHARAFKGTRFNSIVIPDFVTVICDEAFAESSLREITLPNSVVSIGEKAFAKTLLNAIEIPESVNCIGENAFDSCSFLKEANLSNCRCKYLFRVFNNCPELYKLLLPATLIEISSNAFCGCPSLLNITIPSSVKKICNSAFEGSGIYCISVPNTVPSSNIGCNSGADIIYNGIRYKNGTSIQQSIERNRIKRTEQEKEQRLAAERNKKKEREIRIEMKVCTRCGGPFEGIFNKKCKRCGFKKDY